MPKTTWWNLPAEKRQRVYDAAVAEFGERGFEAGSLNVISREAGVSKGSLFQYFEDKLDLWAATVDATSHRVAERLQAGIDVRGELGFFDQFRGIVDDWTSLLASDPVLRSGMIALNREPDDEARRVGRANANRHFAALLESMAKLAVERGEVRGDVHIDVVIWAGATLLRHLAVAPHLGGEDPSLDLELIDADELAGRTRALVDGYERAWAATDGRGRSKRRRAR